MKIVEKDSKLAILFQCLEKFWHPAGEAFRAQRDLGIRSLHETTACLERAGYEICAIDLPEKVSGFAEVIGGKRHVVLNRSKSRRELQYTAIHEFGHHVLHLGASNESDPCGLPRADVELEANLFATAWFFCLRDDKQRNVVLQENSEISRTIVIYLLLSVILVLGASIASFTLPDTSEAQ